MPKENINGNKAKLRKRLAEYQDNLCFFCDEPLLFDIEEKNHPRRASFDHFISRKLGGSNSQSNTVIAHSDCNSKLHHYPKSKKFVEKLAALNVKRGFDGSDALLPMGHKYFGEIAAQSEAAGDLFDRLEQIEGSEGLHIRKKVRRFFDLWNLGIKDFKRMHSSELRYRMACLWIDERLRDDNSEVFMRVETKHGIPIRDYLRNILRYRAKVVLLDDKSIIK